MSSVRCHQCGLILTEESDHCRACGARFVPQLALRDDIRELDLDRRGQDLLASIVTEDSASDRRARLATTFGSPLPVSILPTARRPWDHIEDDVVPDAPRRRWSRLGR